MTCARCCPRACRAAQRGAISLDLAAKPSLCESGILAASALPRLAASAVPGEMICCCRLKPATQHSLASRSHYHCLRSTATKWAYLTVASMQFQWSAPAALSSPASSAGSCQTNYSDRGRVQQLPPVRCSPSCAILKAQKRATRRYDRLVSCNSAQEMRGCKRRFLLSSPQAPGALPAAAPQTPGGCQQLACGARAAPGA